MNPLERFWWRLRLWVIQPRQSYAVWQKDRHRPGVGDVVEDCRGRLCTVVSVGHFKDDPDDLLFDDGTHASWLHCCNWPDDEVTKAVGKGAPSVLLGTSTRALRNSLRKLRRAQHGRA